MQEDTSYPFRLDPYRADRYANPAGKRPLVVVHGYWAQMYPMQWFMHLLADQLPEYALYQYGFESFGGLATASVSLEEVSRILGDEICRVRREHKLADSGVAFVGHSTGGLIARRCFLDRQSELVTARFVFLGTPHFGAEIADIKIRLSSLLHPARARAVEKQTRELTVGSDFIWRLNRDWSRLKEGVVERALSVVGTTSDRTAFGRLPKGRWVQADGVVRATSAVLALQGSAPSLALHIPIDHGALKDISPHWRRLLSIKSGYPEKLPSIPDDLPFIAAIGFLHEFPAIGEPASLWAWCLDYLEDLEVTWRKKERFLKKEGRLTPEGEYEHKPTPIVWDNDLIRMVDEALGGENLNAGDEPRLGEPQFGDEPSFKKELIDYGRQASAYWREGSGSALVRLDFLDIPPLPTLVDLLDAAGSSQLQAFMRVRRGVYLRRGPKWLTLYFPTLAEGTHQVILKHGTRVYEATFQVVRHFTTVCEIDGYTGKSSVLGSSARRMSQETGDGYAALETVIEGRVWDLTVESDVIQLRADED